MMPNDFCVFILTHGRPDRQYTTASLIKRGYSGKIYYVVDTDDATQERYIEKFGEENVLLFDKKEIAKEFDTGYNFGEYGAIVYARNVCFRFAKQLGIRYFMELDDDYTHFLWKIDTNHNYREKDIKNINKPILAMLKMFKKAQQITSVAMAQNGDFIGGKNGGMADMPVKRKLMNSMICDTEREFEFVGALNEDVNNYTYNGRRGKVFFTVPYISLKQVTTQSNSKGMTDVYKKYGTYLKSFYSVMYNPSAVKVSVMQTGGEPRIHHKVTWDKAVPLILPETARNY